MSTQDKVRKRLRRNFVKEREALIQFCQAAVSIYGEMDKSERYMGMTAAYLEVLKRLGIEPEKGV